MRSHLFIIDPITKLNLQLDSSLRLAFALQQAGDAIFYAEGRHLSWHSGSRCAAALATPLNFTKSATEFATGKPKPIPLQDFAAIHMRLEPPFNLDYIATTWLLDSVSDTVRVFNDPVALRRYNEKLCILQFPSDIRPALASSDAEQILQFIATECHGDAMIKSLDQYRGRGILRFQLSEFDSQAAALAAIHQNTDGGKSLRLVQAFESAIYQGEVRAFAAFGEPVAWCLKVPAPGKYLANTIEGARLEPFEPDATMLDRITRVSQELWRQGIAFAAYDLIGGYISEINVTSPRLLAPPRSDERHFYANIADWIRKLIRD